jgi:hypothetical protein
VPIRLPIICLTTIASLLLPALVKAQSSQGTIGVAATILPAAPAPLASRVTIAVDAHGNALVRLVAPRAEAGLRSVAAPETFVRLTRGADTKSGRVFVAASSALGSDAVLRVPAFARDSSLRVERLIVSGT